MVARGGSSTDLVSGAAHDLDATEVKLKALHSLHSGKVRALLNSIGKLQKENAELRKTAKEEKPSRALQAAHEELGQQDAALAVLYDHVKTNNSADKAKELINKALNPHHAPRTTRPPSRVELQMENSGLRQLQVDRDMLKTKLKNANEEIAKLRLDVVKREGSQDKRWVEFARVIDELKRVVEEKMARILALEADLAANQEARVEDLKVIESLTSGKMGEMANENAALANAEWEDQKRALEQRVAVLMQHRDDIAADYEKAAKQKEEEHVGKHKENASKVGELTVSKEKLILEQQSIYLG